MCSPLDGEERLTTNVPSGLMEVSTRGNSGVQQSRKKRKKILFNQKGLFRTDYQGNHVNGQGNIGFCCSACELLNGNITLGDSDQRSKFVQKLDDRVKLPDASAVVFGDPEDKEDRKIPPS